MARASQWWHGKEFTETQALVHPTVIACPMQFTGMDTKLRQRCGVRPVEISLLRAGISKRADRPPELQDFVGDAALYGR